MCQVNPTCGDLSGNCGLVLASVDRGIANKSDVVLLPEMVTTGYPPRDLLYHQDIWDNQENIAQAVLSKLQQSGVQMTVIYGGIEQANSTYGNYARYNVAYIVDPQSGIRTVRKRLLPRYDVFDETRYFVPGEDPYAPVPIHLADGSTELCDVLICEDIWNAGYRGVTWQSPQSYVDDPTSHLIGAGPLFVLNASPFWHNKVESTIDLLRSICKSIDRPVFWCNQVGAHDDIVTGGYSTVFWPSSEVLGAALRDDPVFRMGALFLEDEMVVESDSPHPSACSSCLADKKIYWRDKLVDFEDFDTWCTYQATVLHVRDYFRRCGAKQAVLGLSGGIDSALVAVIAADALGGANVTGITMPSKFSSEGSVSDSCALATNLHMPMIEIPIGDIHQSYRDALLSGGKQSFNQPVTDENLQPRARGNILFAYSNDFGPLVLTTGNKSEISVGYCTLYGDMAGGLGVIGDLWKTEVFDMCRVINKYTDGIIPDAIIEKPPSAELREDQHDTDSLPPYEDLDPILKAIVEDEMPMRKVHELAVSLAAETGSRPVDVHKVFRLYTRSEYKRQQMPPTCKLSERAFGSGRRMPIAAKFTLAK